MATRVALQALNYLATRVVLITCFDFPWGEIWNLPPPYPLLLLLPISHYLPSFSCIILLVFFRSLTLVSFILSLLFPYDVMSLFPFNPSRFSSFFPHLFLYCSSTISKAAITDGPSRTRPLPSPHKGNKNTCQTHIARTRTNLE